MNELLLEGAGKQREQRSVKKTKTEFILDKQGWNKV